MEIIQKYFTEISETQKAQFKKLQSKYDYWNQRINVISRKDMDNFYERHVLHSLAIGKAIQFREGKRIIDIGTGGGFPGIPLAILFPKAHFTLNDSIGKKLKVIDEIAKDLNISNIQTIHSRAEDIHETYDYILSRAVSNLPEFIKISKHLFKTKPLPEEGIYYLKGGNIENELKEINTASSTIQLKDLFEEEFFATKKLVHIPF